MDTDGGMAMARKTMVIAQLRANVKDGGGYRNTLVEEYEHTCASKTAAIRCARETAQARLIPVVVSDEGSYLNVERPYHLHVLCMDAETGEEFNHAAGDGTTGTAEGVSAAGSYDDMCGRAIEYLHGHGFTSR